MKYDAMRCRVLSRDRLTETVYDYTVEAPAFAKIAKPGQFAHIRVPGHVLRRPISICEADAAKGALRFVFEVRGAGTETLSETPVGGEMDILAPLGNGFPVQPGESALFVGGGIGVPPLLGAAKAAGKNSVAALGFRNRGAVILEEDFRAAGIGTRVATDDGSYGTKGVVTALLDNAEADAVYACGPLVMLRAVKSWAASRGIPCWLSLEERMACGIGACLGCAVELNDENGGTVMGHVCKDGPVFAAERVVL